VVYFINKYVQSVCAETQIFWVSDGGHSVHVMSAFDIESTNGDGVEVIGEQELVTAKLSGSGIRLVIQSYNFYVLNLTINVNFLCYCSDICLVIYNFQCSSFCLFPLVLTVE